MKRGIVAPWLTGSVEHFIAAEQTVVGEQPTIGKPAGGLHRCVLGVGRGSPENICQGGDLAKPEDYAKPRESMWCKQRRHAFAVASRAILALQLGRESMAPDLKP